MNTTIFNRIAFSAMLVGFIGLTSCNKNDEPTPTPQEVQQHFTFVHYVDKSAYVGTFSDLTPQATDNKKAFEFGFGCYLFAKGNTVLVPEGKFGDKIHKFTRGAHGELIKAGTMTFEQMAQPGEINFVDEQRAYVALHGRGKIALINTSTLQRKMKLTSHLMRFKTTILIPAVMSSVMERCMLPSISSIRLIPPYRVLEQR